MKKLKRGISQKNMIMRKTLFLVELSYYQKDQSFLPNLWPAYYKKAKGINI